MVWHNVTWVEQDCRSDIRIRVREGGGDLLLWRVVERRHRGIGGCEVIGFHSELRRRNARITLLALKTAVLITTVPWNRRISVVAVVITVGSFTSSDVRRVVRIVRIVRVAIVLVGVWDRCSGSWLAWPTAMRSIRGRSVIHSVTRRPRPQHVFLIEGRLEHVRISQVTRMEWISEVHARQSRGEA